MDIKSLDIATLRCFNNIYENATYNALGIEPISASQKLKKKLVKDIVITYSHFLYDLPEELQKFVFERTTDEEFLQFLYDCTVEYKLQTEEKNSRIASILNPFDSETKSEVLKLLDKKFGLILNKPATKRQSL